MPDENEEVEPSVDNGSIEYEGEDEEVEESEEDSDEEETNDSKYAGTFYTIE